MVCEMMMMRFDVDGDECQHHRDANRAYLNGVHMLSTQTIVAEVWGRQTAETIFGYIKTCFVSKCHGKCTGGRRLANLNPSRIKFGFSRRRPRGAPQAI